jgi:malate/lactate dehydrogenase
MSSFSVKLDSKRPWRYAFQAYLWESHECKFGLPIGVLLDTGSFNTIIHEELAVKYGVLFKKTMATSVGGFKGESSICVLHKIRIGGHEIEKVVALAVPLPLRLFKLVSNDGNFTRTRTAQTLIV